MIQQKDMSFGKLHAIEEKKGRDIKLESTTGLPALLLGGGPVGNTKKQRPHSPPSNYLRKKKGSYRENEADVA